MQWIMDNYPVENDDDDDGNNATTAADDGDDETMELFLLYVSAMSQNFSDDSNANLSKKDWTYLHEVILKYGHVISLSNPIIEFLKQECGRLSQADTAFLRQQPEIIHLYRLQEGSHEETYTLDEELSEREFCALIHAASLCMTPFDAGHTTILVLPQADNEIVTLPASCMPSASIELIVTKNMLPQLVVRKCQAEASALTLPRSIKNNSSRQLTSIHALFMLSKEVSDSAQMEATEISNKLLQETKKFLDTYSMDNCSCKLCNFTSKFSSHITTTPSSTWDFLADINHAECIEVGGYFLSHDTLGQKSIAAVMFYTALTEMSNQRKSSSIKREMGNCLHSFATLLLDAVTLIETQKTNFIYPSPTTIRNHWRSACKMWLRCQKIYPEHDIARSQIKKLFAYGSDYDFMGHKHDYLCRIEDASNITTFDKIPIKKGMNIFRTCTPILAHSECKWIIEEAEKHALKSTWSSNRHYSVPTTDIPLHEIPSVLKWFQSSLQSKLRKLLHDQFLEEFDGDINSIYINDLFIVKYDATFDDENSNNCTSVRERDTDTWHWSSKKIEIDDMCIKSHRRFLPLHYDQSTHSIVIALNSSSEFSGGGTYFSDLREVVSLDEGCMLSFCGNKLLHGGEPITSGVRYIMTMFIFLGAAEEYTRKRKLDRPTMRSGLHENRHEINIKGKRTRKEESCGTSFSSEVNANDNDARVANECKNGDLNDRNSFAFNFF